MRPLQRTSAVWAALAAFGTAYLVTGGALAALQLALRPLGELEMALTYRTVILSNVPESIVRSLALALGAFAGGVVARRAGGVRGLVAFAVVLAAEAALLVGGAFEGMARRLAECCWILTVGDVPVLTAAFLLPAAFALFAGAAVARTAVERGTNPAHEAAGAYALAGVVVVLALGPAQYRFGLVYAPYATPWLEALPHAVAVAAQGAAAAVVLLRRGGLPSVTVFATLALCGLAGVAYADVIPIWNTLFLDWTYVPVSLVAVPLGSALAAAAVLALLRPFRVAASGPSGGG